MNRDVLVVGGGIAGMQAAMLLAEKDHVVHVIESGPSIGGFFPLLDRTFPTNSCGVCFMSATPPAMCPIYESDFHENVLHHTNCSLKSFGGEPGKFQATYVQKPRFVDPDKCTLCGECTDACPVVVDRKFGGGIEKTKAIALPFSQAIPRTYTIDLDACTRCGECVSICAPGAISLSEQPEEHTVEFGAAVLGFGFEPYPAEQRGEYGFGRYQNVVSSIQYERMLSHSGPSGGRPVRPSDGKQAKKVAFIQCVGSRDKSSDRGFCSSICCMYATKQAMISRDRVEGLEAAIFYMDVRTIGKDYERYYDDARTAYGIRYERSAVSTVKELGLSRDLRFAYLSAEGEYTQEDFDLVVLSVGFSPPPDAARVAGLIGVELNEFGFCRTDELNPNATSVPGVFVAGAFRGPRDIPETVVDASGAAADVSGLLDNSGPTPSEPIPETVAAQSEAEETPVVGVFLCDRVGQLAAALDLQAIEQELQGDPDVVVARTIDVTSPRSGIDQIRAEIETGDLNRVVLAGYGTATIERALRGRCAVVRAGIGEQCVDVHMDDPDQASAKAGQLIRAAVMQAERTSTGTPGGKGTNGRVLVVGGGLAGLTSSLALAAQGVKVTLVEKADELGGNALSTHSTLSGSDLGAAVTQMISAVEKHPEIEISTNTQVTSFEGTWGSFRTQISNGNGEKEVHHGAAIVATGGREAIPEEYLYGADERVVTQRAFEQLLADSQWKSSELTSVAMIQCVGSREEGRPYCSRICCGQAIKNIIRLKELNPSVNAYILFRDMRTYGFYEEHYEKARELGVVFIRYEAAAKPVVSNENGTLGIIYRDLLLNEPRSLETDLLVLSSGVVPGTGGREFAAIADVDLNPDGFLAEANPKAAPLDSLRRGVYYSGLCHSPNYAEQVMSQAKAAAARASALLWRGQEDFPANQAFVNERRCSGCGLCVTACPYDARELDDVTGKARVHPDLCKGCGTCAVVCPNGASQQHGFDSATMLDVVDAVVG